MIEVTAAKKKTDRAELARNELQMWHTWNDSGRKPEHLQPLFRSLQPVVQDKLKRSWTGALRIPREAVQAELEKHMVHALKTFDPSTRGFEGRQPQVKTWVDWNLRKVSRYVKNHQNVARITVKRADKIGEFDTTKQWLTQRLGRVPNSLELADELSWPVRDVERMERELVKDIPFSASSEEELDDTLASRTRQQLYLLKYELTPEELVVFEYLTGTGGKPKKKATEIARLLGTNDARIHRLKKAIAAKAEELLL